MIDRVKSIKHSSFSAAIRVLAVVFATCLFAATIVQNLDLIRTLEFSIHRRLVIAGSLIFLVGATFSNRIVAVTIAIVLAIVFLTDKILFFGCSFLILNLAGSYLISDRQPGLNVHSTRVNSFFAFLVLISLKSLFLSLLGVYSIWLDVCISTIIFMVGFSFKWKKIEFARLRPALFGSSSFSFATLLLVMIVIFRSTYNAEVEGDAYKFYLFFPRLVSSTGTYFQPFMGTAMFQYMPKFFEMSLLPGYAFGGVEGAKLLQFSIFGVGLLGWQYFAKLISSDDKLFALLTLALFSSPQILLYVTRSSPDLFLFAIFPYILYFALTHSPLLFPSLCFITGVKYTGVIIAIAVACAFPLATYSSIKSTIKNALLKILSFFIVIGSGLFYFESFYKTGKLIAPIASSSSHLVRAYPSPFINVFATADFFSKGFVASSLFSEVPNFAYGFLGFILFPLLFLPPGRFFGLFSVGAFFTIGIFSQTSQTRYFYFLIPLLIFRSLDFSSFRRNSATVCALVLIVLPYIAWTRNDPHPPALLNSWRKDMLQDYSSFLADEQFMTFVNSNVAKGDRLLVSSWDYNLYVDATPFKQSFETPFELQQILNEQGMSGHSVTSLEYSTINDSAFVRSPLFRHCAANQVKTVNFRFMTNVNIELRPLSKMKVDHFVELLRSAGIHDLASWRKISELTKNYSTQDLESFCESRNKIKTVFESI